MRPVFIAVAITGSVPRKKDNPALPVTPAEQIESTHEAYEAGATLVHIHVRNRRRDAVVGPGAFAAGAGGHPQALPGHDRAVLDRRARARPRRRAAAALESQPGHGVAFDRLGELPDDRLREPAALVQDLATQDAGARHQAGDRDLRPVAICTAPSGSSSKGLMDARPHVQFVMGVQNAMPADEHLLDILLAETQAHPAEGDLDGGRHRPRIRPR